MGFEDLGSPGFLRGSFCKNVKFKLKHIEKMQIYWQKSVEKMRSAC